MRVGLSRSATSIVDGQRAEAAICSTTAPQRLRSFVGESVYVRC